MQTIYECVLETVPLRPDATRAWLAADPYIRRELPGHAADAGQLASLVTDPEFLVAADPRGLFAALQRPGQPTVGNARIFLQAYPHLSPEMDKAGERASYLQLAARRHQSRLADELDKLPLQRPWAARWVRGQQQDPNAIIGHHDGTVRAVAVSQLRGRTVIISGGDDRLIRMWDLRTGQPRSGPLADHEDDVTALAVGRRNGRAVIASGSYGSTVRVWDLESGGLLLGPLYGFDEETRRLTQAKVTALAICELRGQPVVVTAYDDCPMQAWNLESGEQIPAPFGEDRLCSVAMGNRRGRPVIVAGGRRGEIQAWDLESGKPITRLLTPSHCIDAVIVTERQGRPVVVAADDREVRMLDLSSGKQIFWEPYRTTSFMSKPAVAAGAWNGQPVILTAGCEKGIQVRDVKSGRPARASPSGRDGLVQAIATAELNGQPVIVSGGTDGTVRVWSNETGETPNSMLTGHAGKVQAVASGQLREQPVIVSAGEDNLVRIWDPESGRELTELHNRHDLDDDDVTPASVALTAPSSNRSPQKVVIGCRDGTVRVLGVNSYPRPARFFVDMHDPDVAITKIGERDVIVAGGSPFIYILDLETGQIIGDPIMGNARMLAIGIRQGRPVVVCKSVKVGEVVVIDLETTEAVLRFHAVRLPGNVVDNWVSALAVEDLHGRPVVLTGSLQGTVQGWDLESGKSALGPFAGAQYDISAVAFSDSHGQPIVVSGSLDRTLQIWEIEQSGQRSSQIELQHQVLSMCSTTHGIIVGTSAELLRIDFP